MPSKRKRLSKTSLKETGIVSFNSKDNANTFCRFFSNLADLLLQKLCCLKKIGVKTTGEYYKRIGNEYGDFILHNVDVTTIDKILKNLDIAKTSAKFLKDGAPVTAIHPANIVNLPIKLDTFPSKCKIAKIKPLFKKGN